jgi:hypothetical protein
MIPHFDRIVVASGRHFGVTAAGDGGSYSASARCVDGLPDGNRFSGFASAVQTAKAVLRLIGSPGTSLKRVFMSLLNEG